MPARNRITSAISCSLVQLTMSRSMPCQRRSDVISSRNLQAREIAHVRFTPDSDRKSGLAQNVMSALSPKADMCGATANVCFGPRADISVHMLFDDFVSD